MKHYITDLRPGMHVMSPLTTEEDPDKLINDNLMVTDVDMISHCETVVHFKDSFGSMYERSYINPWDCALWF